MRKTFFIILMILACGLSAQVTPRSIGDTLQKRMSIITNSINETIHNKVFLPGIPMEAVVKPADSLLIVDSLHGKITVIIKSLRSIAGNLNIALYDSYKAFANKETPFRGASETVADYTMTVLFDSIPKGVYAIAVFHDEDKDGVLKTNKMNIPMEGYGFSNNIVASFGPPEYSQIRFYFSGKNKTVVINMVYLKLPK